jgi:hypothetical protein
MLRSEKMEQGSAHFGGSLSIHPIATQSFAFSVVLIVITLVIYPITSAPKTQSPTLALGKYLVESVAICFECHSERDFSKPGWPIPPGRVGGGRILWGEGTTGQVVAPNISPDKRTGIGDWSDAEIIRAIREGLGKDGRLLNPEMPYRYFRGLGPVELRSIVMYLRSIPPVNHQLPRMAKYEPGNYPPKVAMDSIHLSSASSAVKRGEYLVRLGGCETCHTPANEQGYIHGMEFAGGVVFQHDNQAAASSNLTPDRSGIGELDEKRFIHIIRTGQSGNRALMSAMPWDFYRNMSDSDLKAVFIYLKAVPPVSHRIDNFESPTFCPKCRNQHGLGDKN